MFPRTLRMAHWSILFGSPEYINSSESRRVIKDPANTCILCESKARVARSQYCQACLQENDKRYAARYRKRVENAAKARAAKAKNNPKPIK